MSNNRFQALNFSDDEDTTKQEKSQQQQQKKNKKIKEQEQVIPLEQVQKESTKHSNPAPKQKGLTAEPHPKDRHSGTGIGKELRKEGGGRKNWGNYKDDLKEEKYDVEQQPTETAEEKAPEAPPEKTLADYYQARGKNVEDVLKQQEVKQQVKKIDEEALKKEKLTVMKTKEDEKRVKEVKKQPQAGGYKSEITTEGAQYLGFNQGKQQHEHKQQRRRDQPQEQQQQQKISSGFQLDDKDFPSL